jgi:hypothetical protein
MKIDACARYQKSVGNPARRWVSTLSEPATLAGHDARYQLAVPRDSVKGRVL